MTPEAMSSPHQAKLAELRALVARMTPGPWKYDGKVHHQAIVNAHGEVGFGWSDIDGEGITALVNAAEFLIAWGTAGTTADVLEQKRVAYVNAHVDDRDEGTAHEAYETALEGHRQALAHAREVGK